MMRREARVFETRPYRGEIVSNDVREILDGLARRPASLPCRLFYDARGSALFERITELPEYYPTRTEMSILTVCAGEIARLVGPGAVVVSTGIQNSPVSGNENSPPSVSFGGLCLMDEAGFELVL
jgi:uncharacterized SAM-dependent methyltransferase